MSRSSFITCAVVVMVALAAGLAQALPYVEVASFNTIAGGMGSTYVYSHAIDGDTGFFQVRGNDAPGIAKITGLSGAQAQSVLVPSSAWIAAAGSTSMTTFYGFGLYGSYLQFNETTSDAIWRIDTASGAITEYVSKAQVMDYTGLTGCPRLSASTIDLAGEHVFYEGTSDSILRTTGLGTLETLADAAALTLAFGNSNISGGMAIDAAGNLYWGNTTSDGIHGRTAAGVLQVVLSKEDITNVTGDTAASFGDVFVGPDGKVYFAENSSDGIMMFDPANPAGTLAYHTTEDELLSGPAGSDSVSTMDWYNGNLTWTKITSESGLFNSVPEPSSMVLLAGALLIVGLGRKAGRQR